MKKQNILFLTILMISLCLVAACGKSTDESNGETGSRLENNHASAPNPSEGEDTSLEQGEQADHNEEAFADGRTESESKKDAYLKKLNEMEEDDRYAESKDTTIEMIDQETERYEKWDEELNDIYGLLKGQLSAEELKSLREEQRDWIVQRDETAKASSLKYKGGSMEPLEYVATQAELTRERCYVLVAKYMK